ncbi:MAG: dihydroorotate dehydrogenase-like protein [Planctomycetes bacterium]|nr:dihydroorotate dehydrogenase-like protein [Planctomycetota bacterium]
MDLSTRWLGFTLPHPIVPGASPLADDLDGVRRLEDAGAPLIALRSLFEEQVVGEQLAFHRASDGHADSYAEAGSFLPMGGDFVFGPEEYLEHLERVKRAVSVPVIGSLNGTTPEGWTDFAARIEQAGADALELNLYDLATEVERPAAAIEEALVDVVTAVRRRIRIPLAVKLSPFFTSLPHVAARVTAAGADALVLFNRFYQPDIDPAALEVAPLLRLSTSAELNLRLRWIAILHGRVAAQLALTGGVHRGVDVVKALQCGAQVVQVVSALLMHGAAHLATLTRELCSWLEEHDWRAVAPMIGTMSHRHCPAPRELERANYAKVLRSWLPA